MVVFFKWASHTVGRHRCVVWVLAILSHRGLHSDCTSASWLGRFKSVMTFGTLSSVVLGCALRGQAESAPVRRILVPLGDTLMVSTGGGGGIAVVCLLLDCCNDSKPFVLDGLETLFVEHVLAKLHRVLRDARCPIWR